LFLFANIIATESRFFNAFVLYLPSTAIKEFLQGTIYWNRAWAFVLNKYTHLFAPANLNLWRDVSPIISA
jgi:hypothetical protein